MELAPNHGALAPLNVNFFLAKHVGPIFIVENELPVIDKGKLTLIIDLSIHP